MEGEKTILTLREDLLDNQQRFAELIETNDQLQKTAKKRTEEMEKEEKRLAENIQFYMDENKQLKSAMKVHQQQNEANKADVVQSKAVIDNEIGVRREIELLRNDMT
jgi:hypothetical protein